jgi:hypothetical protein
MSNQNKNKTPSDISRNNSLGTESSALATVTLAEITPWARVRDSERELILQAQSGSRLLHLSNWSSASRREFSK